MNKTQLYESIDIKLLLKNDLIAGNLEKSIDSFELNAVHEYTPSEKNYGTNDSLRVVYETNNYGHRSEDFTVLDNNKYNILFAGCSTTFGEGVPITHAWPHVVYEYIKGTGFDVGNFANLSFPGAGIKKISDNIFTYCKLFGNPSCIFVLLPDYSRSLNYNTEKNEFEPKLNFDYDENKFVNNANPHMLFYDFLSEYRKLSLFCNSNNIKLIAACWEDIVSKFFVQIPNIENFYYIDYMNNMQEFVDSRYDEIEQIKDRDFLYLARDGRHPGTINHMFVSDFFINIFKEMYE